MDKYIARQARLTPGMTVTPGRIRLFRTVFDMMARLATRLEAGVTFSDETLSGVDARVYRPKRARVGSAPSPGLIWIHGGGLIVGSHLENSVCSRFVAALGIPVVSVRYALAPEYPYPQALDDLVSVVREIHAGALPDVDPARLAVGGQSAGGGLAAALAQRLFDEDMSVQGQLLIYPMLDDRTAVRADIGDREHKPWNKISNITGWSSYLGSEPGQETTPPYAVPSRREHLSGLPPAWVGVGTADMFHDECVAYAEQLKRSGVPCELVTVPGAIHGFDGLPGAKRSEAVKNFNESEHEFLREALDLNVDERRPSVK